MFEDFENRSGFWKDLGSNFTINYSGDAPSFLSSGEMWATMDGSETQTLAAWENGWVLTNNPDGTMTATPKYTSGLISQTLVRVPVGPQTPKSSPTDGVGGVQVAFSADNETIPCLEDIFNNGHSIFEETTFPGGGDNLTFPADNKLRVSGNVVGKTLRVIPKTGYKFHINYESSRGGQWNESWAGGIGKIYGQDEGEWHEYTINKITKTDGSGKEYTIGPCATPSNGNTPNNNDNNDTNGNDNGNDNGDEEEGTNWFLWGGVVIGGIAVAYAVLS
tara:strand:+ start:72 stop:899 length:828 start_codon:yes stop_codon:yes gene_type:complete